MRRDKGFISKTAANLFLFISNLGGMQGGTLIFGPPNICHFPCLHVYNTIRQSDSHHMFGHAVCASLFCRRSCSVVCGSPGVEDKHLL